MRAGYIPSVNLTTGWMRVLLWTFAAVLATVCLLSAAVVVTFPESEGPPRVRWPNVTPYISVRLILAVSAGLLAAVLTILIGSSIAYRERNRRKGRANELR